MSRKFCTIGWNCANTNSLNGTTHTCQQNNNMTSIFSYLFNVTVIKTDQVVFYFIFNVILNQKTVAN